MQLSHIDQNGRAVMVDVSGKQETERTASCEGYVQMRPETLAVICGGEAKKGDVLAAARIAGIMAAKKTSELIPLCHNINLESVTVDITPDYVKSRLFVQAQSRCTGKTGAEMEAMTAVSVACLTIYDMCKAADRGMIICGIRLTEKTGGKTVTGKILSINISEKKGTVKESLQKARFIENFGIEGDAHAGDWHRQVSLLSKESADKVAVLMGKEIPYGRFAENITTEGIELFTLPVGTILCIGEIELFITQIGKECHNECEIKQITGKCAMPTEGVFAKVLRGGIMHAGDLISVL